MTVGGGRINVNGAEFYIEDGGDGPALLFMHGFSFDSRMWCAQREHFSRDYRVLAYDARGFGRSSLPDDSPWSMMADLEGILTRTGATPAILIAHSMAAITACDYACQYPSRVVALVLVSPSAADYPWSEAFMAQWVAYQDLASVSMDAARIAWLGSELFACACADPAVASTVRSMVDDYSGWHWLTQHPVGRGRREVSGRDTIRQPVLLVNGREDSPEFLACAASLAQRMPNAHQLLIEQADHLCNMEWPELFNNEVDHFLTGLEPD